MGSPGASYAINAHDISLEQRIRLDSEVDDTAGLTTPLQQTLILDPRRRPDLSDLLNNPWFVGSPDPATPSGSASE